MTLKHAFRSKIIGTQCGQGSAVFEEHSNNTISRFSVSVSNNKCVLHQQLQLLLLPHRLKAPSLKSLEGEECSVTPPILFQQEKQKKSMKKEEIH